MSILGFTEAVLERLQAMGMSKRDLAERMNVSSAYVTKLIGGSNNFTLRTMVKVARSLDCELAISLAPASHVRSLETDDQSIFSPPVGPIAGICLAHFDVVPSVGETRVTNSALAEYLEKTITQEQAITAEIHAEIIEKPLEHADLALAA